MTFSYSVSSLRRSCVATTRAATSSGVPLIVISMFFSPMPVGRHAISSGRFPNAFAILAMVSLDPFLPFRRAEIVVRETFDRSDSSLTDKSCLAISAIRAIRSIFICSPLFSRLCDYYIRVYASCQVQNSHFCKFIWLCYCKTASCRIYYY